MSYNRLAAAKAGGTMIGIVAAIVGFILSQIYIATYFWMGLLFVTVAICASIVIMSIFKSLYKFYSTPAEQRKNNTARARHNAQIDVYGYCRNRKVCGWDGH